MFLNIQYDKFTEGPLYTKDESIDMYDFVFSDMGGEVFGLERGRGKPCIGVSLNMGANVDLNKYMKNEYQVLPGEKIMIMSKFKAWCFLDKTWELPYGQDLFLDKKGYLTFRKGLYKVGKTLSKQDSDGRVRVGIDCV